jgi:CBS domain-containing protein
VSIHKLLYGLAESLKNEMAATDQAIRAFAEACRRVDDDPRERQRISDIADLLDADETLYAEARAALDRGDQNTALPLLRQCAGSGTGEARWLLAQLLEDLGHTGEAITWYQRAYDDGDTRAAEKLALLRVRMWIHADNAGSRGKAHLAGTVQSMPLSAADDPHSKPDLALIATADAVLLVYLTQRLERLAAPCDDPAKDSLARVLRFIPSDAASDHYRCLADLYCARNHLVHGAPLARENLVKALKAYEVANLLVPISDCAVGRSRTAAWALDSRFACEDYARPCPTNLGRLYVAGRWDARPPTREPIAADVMLPASEVPECRPDTTVMEALERLVQSGTQALPVCEMSRVAGIVTLADLARHINDHLGVPSVTETVKALMRPATIVPADTPLSAITQAIADDGIIVISDSGDRAAGYLTAESVLTQDPRATSTYPATHDRPPLLIPGTGAVLLK